MAEMLDPPGLLVPSLKSSDDVIDRWWIGVSVIEDGDGIGVGHRSN